MSRYPSEYERTGEEAEVAFWRDEIFGEPPEYHEGALADFVARPQNRFPHWICEYLKMPVPIVLEVGCGPLPKLEWAARNGSMVVHAFDPLETKYASIRDMFGIRSSVRSITAKAEHADAVFPNSYFDAAYVRNCLDHGEDPVAGMRALRGLLRRKSDLEVTKQEFGSASAAGLLFYEHVEMVGEMVGYADLHQWDLYEKGGFLWARKGSKGEPLRMCEGFKIVDYWRLARKDGNRPYQELRAVLMREK
jgi:SAM-dependent methyltransferase